MISSPEAYDQLKQRVRLRLAEQADNGFLESPARLGREAIAATLRTLISALPKEPRQPAIEPDVLNRLIEELTEEIVGIGPLEFLLADPEVSEIMVNGPRQIYVERQGKLQRTSAKFRDETQLMSVIERLLDPAGVSVSEAEPCVDASLPDGTRVHVVIPPLALNGPTITIRKRMRQYTMDDWITLRSISQDAAMFLEACVKARVNMIISGATSTGKTTLVSLLSTYIPSEERIITIENVAELSLPGKEHWIRLVARAPNVEGRGEISIRQLVKNALRMRPDRIILGEAREQEALDMIQAMHTGHEGFFTVVHANSPAAALDRLETLMLMSGIDLPASACRLQIATAIDLVVHLGRYPDGSRRISEIAQISDVIEGQVHLEPLFVFDLQRVSTESGVVGQLRFTGVAPKFMKKFQVNNIAWQPPTQGAASASEGAG